MSPLASLPQVKGSRAVIIVNPVSGRGSGRGRIEEIRRAAVRLGWQGRLIETTAKRHAGIIAKQLVSRGTRHIVVCGGDGSVMEALDAVCGTAVRLGIVPIGTGNIFALNLGLPNGLVAALQVALNGQPAQIDVGRANGTYFGVLAGIGWDAALIRDARRELKDRLGLLAYFLAAIRNLEHPINRYRLRVDKQPVQEVRAKSIVVANMGLMQGHIQAIPKARPDNGELTVAVVQADSLFSWVGLSASVLAGRLTDDPRIILQQGRHIEIESLDGAQLIEADGSILPESTMLTVDVIPGGATIMLRQPR